MGITRVYPSKSNTIASGEYKKFNSGQNAVTELFINKAKVKHNGKYGYELVDYKNSQTKVKIICPEHGVFEQRPNDHIQGKGCIDCAGLRKKTTESFIHEANNIHKGRYNYEQARYSGANSRISIICYTHGLFQQQAGDHLKGIGCAKCAKVGRLNTEDFIIRASDYHGSTYDYSKVAYKNMHSKVEIVCKKHGSFYQTPHNHLKFSGCPGCKRSKGEKIISWFLTKENIDFEEQKKFEGCKNKAALPFDFYLPQTNTCIEFQGIQHFEAVNCMDGEQGFKERSANDKLKKEYCNKNDIKLIEVKYSDNIAAVLRTELKLSKYDN